METGLFVSSATQKKFVAIPGPSQLIGNPILYFEMTSNFTKIGSQTSFWQPIVNSTYYSKRIASYSLLLMVLKY